MSTIRDLDSYRTAMTTHMILLYRLVAFLIDYLLLGCYASLLFAVALQLGLDEQISSPWSGQLVGLLGLTIPVILYFTILENSSWHASVGKRVMRLSVTDSERGAAPFAKLLVRNVLKFLPWEIAYLGIHWTFYYQRQDEVMANWVWGPLILSQLLAISYVISIVVNSGNQGLYERCSGTRVTPVEADELRSSKETT